jgi:hypothetical protein
LEKQSDIDTAGHYVLNRPNFFLNTVGDIQLLPKVLDAASRFRPVAQDAVEKELAQLDTEPLFV